MQMITQDCQLLSKFVYNSRNLWKQFIKQLELKARPFLVTHLPLFKLNGNSSYMAMPTSCCCET